MKKIVFWGVFFFLLSILPGQTHASTLNCSDVDGMAIFGYNGSDWVHIGAIGNKLYILSIANEIGAGNKIKSTSIMNDIGKYGSKISFQSAFNNIASKPPIIVNNNYKFLGYITINDYKTPSINTYEAIACAKNSLKSPNKNMEYITFRDIPENDQIQSQLRTVTDATGSAYSDELKYQETLNNFYESKAQDLNKKIETLSEQEREIQITKIADLEAKIKNTQSIIDNYCTNTYGINSLTLSPGKCSCNAGYVIGKENKCISISNWCSELSNTYMKDGTCTCLDGYSYNSAQKICKVIEIKKVVAQPVVIKKEPIKNTSDKTPPTSLKNPVEKESINNVVAPKEVAPQVAPEPVKKLKWYQKIFNWFK